VLQAGGGKDPQDGVVGHHLQHQGIQYTVGHRLINIIDTRAKCCYINKLTYKGTLRQVFIRVYRLEIQAVMLVFSTQLCELLPLSLLFSVLTLPPSPLPFTRIQCARGGGVWGSEPQTDTPAAKSLYRSIFFR
jgi:hypothetical protein